MMFSRAAAVALLAALSACAVGPDFQRPAPPAASDYGTAPLKGETASVEGTAGNAQRFVADMDIPAQWWALFQSPKLTKLVEEALKKNPNIDAAQAALRQSHELYLAQKASFFPVVQGGLGASRAGVASSAIANPTVSTTSTYSLYTAQLSLSYSPDVFGGTRRSVEAAKAQVEASRFQLEATYLTLSSNVVVAAVQEALYRDLIATTQKTLELQHRLTETVRAQKEIGTASNLDLLTQESAEAQTAATLPPLQKQLGQTRDALTALLGRLPSGEPAETFQLDELTLPSDLPVSLPSKVVEHRPDVRQAEENLHVASAEVGVAVANLLPQFTLSGDTGSAALRISQLFGAGNGFWDLGASLTQTLFDAGALLHKRRAAVAALDQAGAQYRSAVVLACQNVADTLRALQADADALKASAQADRAAKTTLDTASRQYKLGTISLVAVINAELVFEQTELALVQARVNRYLDTAALFQALGGGWWNRSGESLNEQPRSARE